MPHTTTATASCTQNSWRMPPTVPCHSPGTGRQLQPSAAPPCQPGLLIVLFVLVILPFARVGVRIQFLSIQIELEDVLQLIIVFFIQIFVVTRRAIVQR